MVNYEKSKIYKIESFIGNCIYYGSTCEALSVRMAKHRYNYKHQSTITSSKVLCFPDAKIYLVESYPCENIEELQAREGWFIKHNECVNKNVPGRTRKQYLKDNDEKIKQDKKREYERNKSHYAQYKKKWHSENKQKIQLE